jgi:Ribonuclease toxin, BrnT, of type II toxin-antitoxin system
MAFEWDPRKAAANVRKHGVRFADAIPVLEDERALTVVDESSDEERWVTIGMDSFARVDRAGGGNYQSLINQALHEFMNRTREPLELTLRRVIREELRRTG